MYNNKCEKTFEILRSEITCLMDLYVAGGWVWRKIKLVQTFMGVLFTCKNEEDPFKNEGARVVTTDLPL